MIDTTIHKYCKWHPHITFLLSYSKIRVRWVGHVAHTGERRGAYRVLVGKPEGQRLF
jgi:hypothetical protein